MSQIPRIQHPQQDWKEYWVTSTELTLGNLETSDFFRLFSRPTPNFIIFAKNVVELVARTSSNRRSKKTSTWPHKSSLVFWFKANICTHIHTYGTVLVITLLRCGILNNDLFVVVFSETVGYCKVPRRTTMYRSYRENIAWKLSSTGVLCSVSH